MKIKKIGFINDQSGKCHRFCVFYVLSGVFEKTLDFSVWFEHAFPEDIGEPIFDLYWTLVYYRTGNIERSGTILQ